MALDPFASLSAEARKRGYDPLAVMAGLGVGRARAGELAMEREKLDRAAQQQASEMQIRARQMEQEAAAQAARREYEMKQLGMTETQQRQAAELQQRQLDRQFAEMQSNEAYRQASLAQAPQLAAQQAAAQAERERLAREANAAEALLGRQFTFGLEQQRQRAESERETRRVAAETARDAARIKAEKEIKTAEGAKLPAAVVEQITKPIPTGQVDAQGELVTDLEGRPLTRPPTQQEMQQRAVFFASLFGAKVPQFSTAPAAGGGAGRGGLAALMNVLEKQAEDRRRIEARRGAK